MCKVLLCLLFILTVLMGTAFGAEQKPPNQVIDINTVSSAVVMIRTEFVESVSVQGETYEILLRKPGTDFIQPKLASKEGTGTLVAKGSDLYLLTAEHVAKGTTSDSVIVMKVKDDRPEIIPITQLIGKAERPNWIVHPVADLAAMKLYPQESIMSKLEQHFLSYEILVPEFKAPNRQRPVITVGFPLGLGTKGSFSPISQESKTVSGLVTLPRLDTQRPQEFFLLDKPSIGGFSGAPVLELPGMFIAQNEILRSHALRWVGVMHGTTGDDTGGKLAVVTPAAFVLELLGAKNLEEIPTDG